MPSPVVVTNFNSEGVNLTSGTRLFMFSLTDDNELGVIYLMISLSFFISRFLTTDFAKSFIRLSVLNSELI